jgi:hypothetical protein
VVYELGRVDVYRKSTGRGVPFESAELQVGEKV